MDYKKNDIIEDCKKLTYTQFIRYTDELVTKLELSRNDYVKENRSMVDDIIAFTKNLMYYINNDCKIPISASEEDIVLFSIVYDSILKNHTNA